MLTTTQRHEVECSQYVFADQGPKFIAHLTRDELLEVIHSLMVQTREQHAAYRQLHALTRLEPPRRSLWARLFP